MGGGGEKPKKKIANKNYEDVISVPGSKSISLGLGGVSITRKINSLDINSFASNEFEAKISLYSQRICNMYRIECS